MNRRISLVTVVLALVLAGCGSPYVAAGIARSVGQVGPPAAQPAAGAPLILVTLPKAAIKFPMALLKRDGPVSIWASSDGAQIFLRDGMLVGTRGIGRDLMSAQVPVASAVAAKTVHDRVYFDLDGSDTMIRHDFSCQGENAPPGDEIAGTQHFSEVCQGTLGRIRNQFWIDRSGNVQKSVQWVTETVGYLVIAPSEDVK